VSALDPIIEAKREHVAAKKSEVTLAGLEEQAKQASAPRGFVASLRKAKADGRYGLICEIKKASPSKGLIRADFQPASLAAAYEAGGASCLSVLTDIPYFQGHDDYLGEARSACTLPVLRKDFMIDPYQITESRALNADCILLIMAALSDDQAQELEAAALAYGMDVLIEVHNRQELDRALELKSPLIGINNRNLKTMQVSLETTIELAPKIPQDRIIVGESGIFEPDDLALLARYGVNSFLIGESLMRQDDVAQATRRLMERAA
jgi:indole-3-glycerol phosphate synthase